MGRQALADIVNSGRSVSQRLQGQVPDWTANWQSRPAAVAHGGQLSGELNFIAATLDARVIERMGTSMYLREHYCLNATLCFDHLSHFAQMRQQVIGELPAQPLAMRRWAARQPTDAAA